MWKNTDPTRHDSAHYSIMTLDVPESSAMEALRGMFPDAKANQLNFVLFSTSGVHGTYNSIEEAERSINNPDDTELCRSVTFLVVHPRLVALRYGQCIPQSMDDIAFLKALRANSHFECAGIGMDDVEGESK